MNDKKQIQLLKNVIDAYESGEILEEKSKFFSSILFLKTLAISSKNSLAAYDSLTSSYFPASILEMSKIPFTISSKEVEAYFISTEFS